jgi:hypothetical protein
MTWVYAERTLKGWRVLAWTTLIAVILLLAVLLHAVTASALIEPLPRGPFASCQSAEAATAALADGDDVRARFLANLCGKESASHPEP